MYIYILKTFRFFVCLLFSFIVLISNSAFAKIEAVIFDCDGVLVDTEYLKFEAWKKALNEREITFSIEEYIPLIGFSSKKILTEILLTKNSNTNNKIFERIIDKKNKIYEDLHSRGVRVYTDAINFLEEVMSKKEIYNYKVAIVSSAPKKEIILNMKHAHINTQLLDLIASGEDDLAYIMDKEKNKPKPYIYLHAAKLLKVDVKNCIVFEDTSAGVNAAFRAGMRVFAVPNNLTINQDFSNALGTISFKNFSLKDFFLREGG